MSWAAKQHPIELIAEWIAPIPLALAIAWAGWRLGFSTVEGAAVGIAALTAGFAAMRFIGPKGEGAPFEFAPAEIEPELDELLLEAKDELLELDDPLVDVAPDARVVRLFARPEPTPGELLDRIADFLGDGRRPAPELIPEAAKPADASAALQAALANIRASLR